MTLSISIAAAKDGKAAKGSLGVGAVKSLRTIPPKLDLLPGLISDSRILLTAAPGFGNAGDQRAPPTLARMVWESTADEGYSKAVTMSSSSLSAKETEFQKASLRRDSKSRAGILLSLTDGLKTDRPRDEGVGAPGITDEEPRVSPFLFLLGRSKDEARARLTSSETTSLACSVGTRGAEG